MIYHGKAPRRFASRGGGMGRMPNLKDQPPWQDRQALLKAASSRLAHGLGSLPSKRKTKTDV
jgi:hypothetical protein